MKLKRFPEVITTPSRQRTFIRHNDVHWIHDIFSFINNMELNNLRKNICLRTSKVSVERISVDHVIRFFCSYTNDAMDMSP